MNTSNVGGNSHMEEAMDIDPIDQTGMQQLISGVCLSCGYAATNLWCLLCGW